MRVVMGLIGAGLAVLGIMELVLAQVWYAPLLLASGVLVAAVQLKDRYD